MNASELISHLKAEKINTWFDLGLFVDRIKDSRDPSPSAKHKTYGKFKESISSGGIAFVSFFYSVDGASMECDKYVRAFQRILGDFEVHYIAGKFYETGNQFLVPGSKQFQMDELSAFDDWDLYNDFFYKKLERGSKVYNSLITRFWAQVIAIVEKLATYIEDQNIGLIYLLNINSNPGNVSEALAFVLISELMDIPVINNNHDFYWEGGNSEIDIQEKKLKPGPRDHFFKNYHLGEVFSLLEIIYPWESRKWMSLNINQSQCDDLIDEHGHNPANVLTINTCVDVEKFKNEIKESRKTEILNQVCHIFSNGSNEIKIHAAGLHNFDSNIDRTKLKPILFGIEDKTCDAFEKDNIFLLQPTRILRRKAIEVNFTLIRKLLTDPEAADYFEQNDNLKITLLVTGPIATGQVDYWIFLISKFNEMLLGLGEKFRSKVFLGFMLSAFDKKAFQEKFPRPLTLPELYKTSSMIVLPSETEGRGLPIIEAAASGMPIFCRRYYPEHVFAHVIGENLPKNQRLTVTAFRDPSLGSDEIESVKRQIFAPKAYETINQKNKEIVKHRFSFESLTNELENVLLKLFLQVNSGQEDMNLAQGAIEGYETHLNHNKVFSENLINTENRQYLAGYGQLLFMLMLKSLIDPSYFRVEEKRVRGMAMHFAKELIDNTPDPSPIPMDVIHKFYNSVDSLFLYRKDEMELRFDHSMAYRHRSKTNYPYRTLTSQELTGVINTLYHRLTDPPPVTRIGGVTEIKKDWYQNLSVLYEGAKLKIDHIDDLEERLMQNKPVALFPGKFIELELELFVLAPIRFRLNLAENGKIDERTIGRKKLAPIFIIQHEQSLGNSVTADILKSYIYYSGNIELITVFKHGICKIIASKQKSVGLHFYEIGELAANALNFIKDNNGILITTGDHATMMTDIVDIDRFHIGKTNNTLAAKILGIKLSRGYVQWVPAGLRFALSYPTPIQTGKDFSKALKGFRFQKLCTEIGREKVLEILKKDAAEKGSPIKTVLKSIEKSGGNEGPISHSAINGVHADGFPWSGAMARVNISSEKSWGFSVVETKNEPKTVLKFVEEFNMQNGRAARVAWNGGYILNPELVGKLGIPETFIGSPLGLIISNGEVKCPPLFNKAAFLVNSEGRLSVERVNCESGIKVELAGQEVVFLKEGYNLEMPGTNPCYYDLLYPQNKLPGNGRVLIRLAGNTVKDIIKTSAGETVPVLPVGLTLSLPASTFLEKLKIGDEVKLHLNGLENIVSAIEAGPQLLMDGKECLDMEVEGWKTENSINTQAARLDFTDMRGPKIAIGINKEGNLFVLTINGRIRESVGATHFDMAEILKKQGMIQGMGFDPGGSSTLVVDGKTVNISPYNSAYEKDVYSLAPEPRMVANAFIVS
ncbi:MAG: hypothetical protein D8M58_07750 [Calditrichaeota bacterium]|nr:MAG: hypothetical protein DWQ03_18740 [Calditrichota bacterium]MBL1205274.1 hypothetical protein [Calditrichota bacterium]NOG45103.1 hypothetical protein [Calditrichota bacterium]